MATITGSSDVEPEWAVDGVSRETIEHVWDDAWPYLERSIARSNLRVPITEASLYRSLMRGERQLWIGWSYTKDRLVGAVVTEVYTDASLPDFNFMSIRLVGGEDWMKWGDTMWTLLKNWGRAQGCTHFIGTGGRLKAWSRLYGFTHIGTTAVGDPVYVRKL